MPGSPPAERLHRRRRTGELTPVPAAWSDVELLRHKDFATYTDAEMALARLLIAQLARRGPTRLSRRTQAVSAARPRARSAARRARVAPHRG